MSGTLKLMNKLRKLTLADVCKWNIVLDNINTLFWCIGQSIHLTHFSQYFNFLAPANLKKTIQIDSKWNIGSKKDHVPLLLYYTLYKIVILYTTYCYIIYVYIFIYITTIILFKDIVFQGNILLLLS